MKPKQIQSQGTKVILLGKAGADNTIEAPGGVASPSRWIAKYLNTRYFRFPEGIRVQAREGWQYPREDTARNKLRTIAGQHKFLEERNLSSGKVELNGAVAHWWILEDSKALRQESNYYASTGHVAALHKNELYELAVSRAGVARLQQFGIVFGHRFVVIYIEPTNGLDRSITTNTARTQLIVDGEPLPWADIAAEFRDKMPAEIQNLIDEKATDNEQNHRDAIRDRLKPLLDLFRLSRFRPNPRGDADLSGERVPGGAPSTRNTRKTKTGEKGGGQGGAVGSVYAAFQKHGGEKAEKVETDPFPTVHWLTVANGRREAGDLEDRAARFLKDQNLLLVNGDFRLVTDTVKYWTRAYGEPTRAVVEEVVREWVSQALVESVLGVQALEGSSREWNAEDISRALSEEALTTAIQQRYHIHNAVKRSLGSKLGKLMAAAS